MVLGADDDDDDDGSGDDDNGGNDNDGGNDGDEDVANLHKDVAGLDDVNVAASQVCFSIRDGKYRSEERRVGKECRL